MPETNLQELMTRLDQLIADATAKAESAVTAVDLAYWRGVLFGLETAKIELQAS